MLVRVKSREHRSAARRAERSSNECVFEMHAILCERIHVQRFQKRMAQKPERIIALIVGEYENDVASFRAGDFGQRKIVCKAARTSQRQNQSQPYNTQSKYSAHFHLA